MRFIISFLLFISSFQWVLAGPTLTLQLKDGSVVKGEMISMSNGVYKIKSNALGTVKITDSQVKSMSSGSSSPNSPSNSDAMANYQKIQKDIMSNPNMMKSITSMQQDPQVMKLIQDPTFANALKSGDINKIMNSPNFKKLLQNPNLRNITNQYAK
ncbi:MAG: hypothetical protein HON94_11570 [Methylococcales bacterium]|jgi:hypothetical protein|nr:hypothetical protein [Methylococcales bacterium]